MEPSQSVECSCSWFASGAPYSTLFEQKDYWLNVGIEEVRKILATANKEMAAILLGVTIVITGNKEAMNAVYAYTRRVTLPDEGFSYVNLIRLIHAQIGHPLARRKFIEENIVAALSFVGETEKRKLYNEVFSEQAPDKPTLIIERDNFLRILRISLGIEEA
jgi:hypothetical protein